ncbi:MAG: geranylgeranylglyceryl/heptaprenylglyceryl phosphate synthase [Bacteroidetes bacterium]|nr:MAG: geranylgeranylglyceryl/heptaprenylglyceryl phosphate synthase [Bacteroidota bacterium]
MNNFYQELKDRKRKRFALLIDPDHHDDASIDGLIGGINANRPDLILVGGSLLFKPIDMTITALKLGTKLPVFIFPGSAMQLSDRADGILLISLISGRNPEFLIGQHVQAAPHLDRSGIEVIPTAYMLIENGKSSSVEYVSNTRPIPFGKHDIAVATAMAGEMLGHKAIYLEAGSGAAHPVGLDMIAAIRRKISLPLIVGGGIASAEIAREVYEAGADMIVVGTAVEEQPGLLADFCRLRDEFNGPATSVNQK